MNDKFVPTPEVLKAHAEYMAKLMAIGFATGRGDRERTKEILNDDWPEVERPEEW